MLPQAAPISAVRLFVGQFSIIVIGVLAGAALEGKGLVEQFEISIGSSIGRRGQRAVEVFRSREVWAIGAHYSQTFE